MRFFLLTLCFVSVAVYAQLDTTLLEEIKKFREEENEFYRNAETSPLKKKERKEHMRARAEESFGAWLATRL